MAGSGHFAPARVRATRDVAADVRLIEIEPETPAEPYPSGSHIDIAVILDGLPDVRSYSLVGEGPVDGAYRIAVKELPDSRGGSVYVRALEGGAEVEVSRPKSHFELQHGRPEYLLVAGGIGITPLVGMAHALERAGQPLRMLYAARERGQLAFADELRDLLGDRLELIVSSEGARLDLAAEFSELHPDAEVYLCGPRRLRDAAQRAWRELGRPRERLRFETFGTSGRFPTEAFAVCVHDHGGRTVEVPRNRTMLESLRDAGVEIMADCLRGECGLCTVTVLAVEGELDHRDVFLSDDEQAENARICTCVSRAVGGAVTIDTGFRPRSERLETRVTRAADRVTRS